MTRILASLIFLLAASLAPSANAQDKVALIIGNSHYQSVTPLRNPAVDAARAETVFTALGFTAITALEADMAAFRDALRRFSEASDGAELAVVYYAGHGVQIDNRNYLLPVDSRAETPEALFASSVPVEDVIGAISSTAEAALVMLDACRDNPFAELTRSLAGATRGLARGDYRADDLMILYAAQPNEVALDGSGQNSPFMEAVGDVLLQGDTVRLNDALIDIAAHVRTSMRDRQIPYVEGSLTQHLEFAASRGTGAATEAEATPRLCPAGALDLMAMDEDGDGWIGLEDRARVVSVGPDLAICLDGDGIRVDGAFPASYNCDDLLDPVNEGAGYYYRDASGAAAHLWFYVDSSASDKTLELGVYREAQEQMWISTGWPICR